ncbi:hypothetical protein EBR57_07360, partial [bacterium]|nr:hypothetical protein [bacterium]
MTQLKRCAVPCHPNWPDVNGQCHGFVITMYLRLSAWPPTDRRVVLDSKALALVRQIQSEHMINPVAMPSVLANYDAASIAAIRLDIKPQTKVKGSLSGHLEPYISRVVGSKTLTIMTLVSRDYPGHTFLIDGRSRMGDLWIYDSHLPALLTRIDSARFDETLYQYTLSKLVQIINY